MNLEKIEKQLYSDKFLDEKNNYICLRGLDENTLF